MKKKTRTQVNNAVIQMKAAMNADIINHLNNVVNACGSVQNAAALIGIDEEEIDRILNGVGVESVDTLFRILIATDNSMMIVPLGGHMGMPSPMPMPRGGMRPPMPHHRGAMPHNEGGHMGGSRAPIFPFGDSPIPPMGDMPNIPTPNPQMIEDEEINEMPQLEKPLDAMSRRELVDLITRNFDTANLDLVNMTRSEMIDLVSREISVENETEVENDVPTKDEIMSFISNELDNKTDLYDMMSQFLSKKKGNLNKR